MQPPPGIGAGTLKGAQDWLTEADGAVERFLSAAMLERFSGRRLPGRGGRRCTVRRAPLGGGPDRRHQQLRPWRNALDGFARADRGTDGHCLGVLGRPPAARHLRRVHRAGRHAQRGRRSGLPPRRICRARSWSAAGPRGRPNEGLFRPVQPGDGCGRHDALGRLGRARSGGGRGRTSWTAYVEMHINLWDVAAALAVLVRGGCGGQRLHGRRSGPVLGRADPGGCTRRGAGACRSRRLGGNHRRQRWTVSPGLTRLR